jgi:hypothetical protein
MFNSSWRDFSKNTKKFLAEMRRWEEFAEKAEEE